MKPTKDYGALLCASHALQPNSFGYCGPDINARILEHLHQSSVSPRLLSTLSKFEALLSLPFVKLLLEPFASHG